MALGNVLSCSRINLIWLVSVLLSNVEKIGSFILPGGCACDKRDFLAIGEVGTNDGKNDPDVPTE